MWVLLKVTELVKGGSWIPGGLYILKGPVWFYCEDSFPALTVRTLPCPTDLQGL